MRAFGALPESRAEADADRHRPQGPLHVRYVRGLEVKANCLDVKGMPEASRIRQWVAQSMSHFAHASAIRTGVAVSQWNGRQVHHVYAIEIFNAHTPDRSLQ